MGWIFVLSMYAGCGLVLAAFLGLRAVGRAMARRIVARQPRPLTRIHASTPTTVTLEADRRTLHRGHFGLWFGDDHHALVGEVRAHDPQAATVTREILHTSGDVSTAAAGYWTGHLHPGPTSLRRPFRDVMIDVPDGTAPAWLIEPAHPARRDTWAIHIHGWNTTRITALRSVHATDALGMTSLVVSFRGDGEGPEVSGGLSTLGLCESADVDAAIAYALRRGATSVVLVGWSMGGAIALLLAESSPYRAFIERLVLIGPVTDWPAVVHNGARERGLPAWTAKLAIEILADPLESARLGLCHPVDFGRLDWSRPGRLAVPALVIHSEGDRTVPLASSVLFAMANPDRVRLAELSPAEHGWEYNVDPAAFNRAIIEFIEPG